MKKQELIKHIEELPYNEGLIVDTIKISRKGLLELVSQLDEPEKAKIPQFVADVIEGAREQNVELEDAFEYVWEVATGELRKWFGKLENRNNFARAWLDGYEVEEEPIYVIRSKGTTNKYGAQQRLCHSGEKGNYFWCGEFSKFKHKFTREELEQAGFGWVFDCEGVEVEEVE